MSDRKLRVLVACEFSGIVRRAFRERGHDAWSADLLPAEDDSEYHVIGDATKLLGEQWDLLIAHPPCTYLTNAGVRWLYNADGSPNSGRLESMARGVELFLAFLNSGVPSVCVENPVMHKHARQSIGAMSQSIQPYEFGHAETKRTCLWLRNLSPLTPTSNRKAEVMRMPYRDRAKVHWMSQSKDRWKERSRTYQGIAEAMATQWGVEVQKKTGGR
jgi:hypothetical protein